MTRCSIDDCDRQAKNQGLCPAHYRRLQRHGDPLGGNTSRGEMLRYIKDVVLPYDGDECLIWPYSLGRGMLMVDKKRINPARYVCTLAHGEPPHSGMHAANSCGNGHSSCVAKRHLRWATPKENAADKIAHGTIVAGEKSIKAKLSSRDVVAIRRLAKSGVPIPRIASAFDMSYEHTRKIVALKTRIFDPVNSGEIGENH